MLSPTWMGSCDREVKVLHEHLQAAERRMTGHPEDTTARSRQVLAILHDYLLALDEGRAPDREPTRSCSAG